MLTQIDIKDFATIASLQLYLKEASTMITGETGAGKSIFIEAIELALGGRASPDFIRPGKDKAEISLCFDISHFPHVIDYLQTLDLYRDAPECIIRRVLTQDGRSRSYVNASPVPVQVVKELGELLFHLHSQHEQQILLKADKQRDILDRYADHLPLCYEVKTLAEQRKKIDSEIHHFQIKINEKKARSDYLRFQLQELELLDLQSNEWEQLEYEHKKLSHADELIQALQKSLDISTENADQNLFLLLQQVRKIIEPLQQIEPEATKWVNKLLEIDIELKTLSSAWKNYLDINQIDTERLAQTEARLGQIFGLARKHKLPPEALFNFKLNLENELATLDSSEETLAILEKNRDQIEKNYAISAEKLTQSRKKAAKKLGQFITETIQSLALPHGKFEIDLEKETTAWGSHGQEKIIFLVSINPDQAPKPLAKNISGGELSRLSLAAHLALADRTRIPTLVFDEVDTGLGGAIAEKIGKLIRELGNHYQVFCITHQPQVAALGHHHLLVEKYILDQRTHTRLRILNLDEKTQEIARMLGGEHITETTLEHAKEVLQSI